MLKLNTALSTNSIYITLLRAVITQLCSCLIHLGLILMEGHGYHPRESHPSNPLPRDVRDFTRILPGLDINILAEPPPRNPQPFDELAAATTNC